ncbi:cyclic peptide export ABC transporter [Xanthobacteraceae bacterium A53D]
MALISFILEAPRRRLALILALTILAGAANALLVVGVNGVADLVARGMRPGLLAVAIYGGALLAYYLAEQFAMMGANRVIERLLRDLRLRLMDQVRRSELPVVARLGQGHLTNLVAAETNHLSITFPMVIEAVQQAMLLTAVLVYLAWLSPAALGVFLLAVAVGAIGYRMINRRYAETLAASSRRQAQMLDAIDDIVHGAKELRLNRAKSDDVFKHYRRMARRAENMLVASIDQWADLTLLSSVVAYLMLGVVVFTFPTALEGYPLIVFQLLPVLLFSLGPLMRIVALSPMVIRAEQGLAAMRALEADLSAGGAISPEEARAEAPRFSDFRTLAARGITYAYRGPDGATEFTAGPLDLEIARGEMVFLVGGNGSGKSTALRLLTGLYPASAGFLAVDGTPVMGRAVAGYRELFSAIFADFYLFDRLYGLEGVDDTQVNSLIAEMGLAGVVTCTDGAFSRLTLSTGQRKRLALVAALLEDRPIYVFDEWSAEQDVHFRDQFYRSILPSLKARGKTVIAVTHDDRYWHLADRVVKMELGQVAWEKTGRDLETA